MMLPPLAVSLCDLRADAAEVAGARPARGNLTAQLELVREAGCGLVVLDAAGAGLRARELDQSARRDVAAMCRRAGVRVVGLDLWVPPGHWAEAARVDRAFEAAREALGLLADLHRLTEAGGAGPGVLTVELPTGAAEAGAAATTLASFCAGLGVLVADVGAGIWAGEGAGTPEGASMVLGVDPAGEMLTGRDVLVRAGRAMAARLSDAGPLGRVEVGAGRLDVVSYAAGLATRDAGRRLGYVTLDVRGVRPARGEGMDGELLSGHAGVVRRAAAAWAGALGV